MTHTEKAMKAIGRAVLIEPLDLKTHWQKSLMMVAFLLFCTGGMGQRVINDVSLLRDGDLLFQVPLSDNAITTVRHGISSLSIDHVGIFHRDNGVPMVLEATYAGVVDTPLSAFGLDCAKVLVGRMRGSFDIRQSLANAHSLLGRAYDFIYLPDNAEIYCSELVQQSFVDRHGHQVFSPIPMSFHDESGTITNYWSDYYSRRLLTVPEGQPGSHPGDLSRRKNVRIKYEWQGIAK